MEIGTTHEPSSPPNERGWVLCSTLASRAAGQISILACVETVLAVLLYWWVAIRFDTHWHLVSSVFIAPLLLLRSPESMATGVRWFLKDWFGVGKRVKYANGHRHYKIWFATIAVIVATGVLVYGVSSQLSHDTRAWLASTFLFRPIVVVGTLATASMMSLTLVFVGAFADATAQQVEEALDGEFTRTTTASILLTTMVTTAASERFDPGLVGASVSLILMIPSLALGTVTGVAVRSLFVRVLATLHHLSSGLRHLPSNWKENNFLTDSCLPAELLPGIRESAPTFTLETWMAMATKKRDKYDHAGLSILFILLFFPAFLYRLNIKATAWFWWPLAFLLKPTPVAHSEGQRKQALCWPWTNPWQKLWIGISALLMVVSVTWYNLNGHLWEVVQGVSALPLPIKVIFAVDWQHIRLWHWTQWTTAGAGLGMLWYAGNARSHDLNGNWDDYCRHWKRHIRVMTFLGRMHTLAVIGTLGLAAGALLAAYPSTWQKHVSIPPRWIQGIKSFYETGAPTRQQHRLLERHADEAAKVLHSAQEQLK